MGQCSDKIAKETSKTQKELFAVKKKLSNMTNNELKKHYNKAKTNFNNFMRSGAV